MFKFEPTIYGTFYLHKRLEHRAWRVLAPKSLKANVKLIIFIIEIHKISAATIKPFQD